MVGPGGRETHTQKVLEVPISSVFTLLPIAVTNAGRVGRVLTQL